MIDPSYYCPGCNRIRCSCPPPWWEEAQAEEAYCRGYDDGREYGPENRPSESWLRNWLNPRPEPCPAEYLDGFDDAASGRPNAVEERYERLDRQREEERREASCEAAVGTLDDVLPF